MSGAREGSLRCQGTSNVHRQRVRQVAVEPVVPRVARARGRRVVALTLARAVKVADVAGLSRTRATRCQLERAAEVVMPYQRESRACR